MKTDIYTLAHEMKNPLSVVKGYLEMLNSKNVSKYKSIMQEEIDTSLNILNQYLEYNKVTLNKEIFDLNIFLLEIKRSMKDYLKKENVSLIVNMIDDEIYVEADYAKLKQVIYNVIKNSVESLSRKINVSYQVLFNQLKIVINNDGNKIVDSDIKKIGNNFSNKVLGNGIGTTLSKKIIRLHGGKIKYINNEKKGVSVIITLPLS